MTRRNMAVFDAAFATAVDRCPCVAPAFATSRNSFIAPDVRPRSRDAFAPESCRPKRSRKVRGARDAGGPTDPRASASRDTEAERRSRPRPPSGSGRNRKSAFSPASRARCLRLSSAWPPVAEWLLPTAVGPLWPPGRWTGVTAATSKDPVTPTVAPGPCSFSRRALGVRVASGRGHRSPVPLNDASRSALGWTGLRAVCGRQRGAGISAHEYVIIVLVLRRAGATVPAHR
jgi:hypothetical protein